MPKVIISQMISLFSCKPKSKPVDSLVVESVDDLDYTKMDIRDYLLGVKSIELNWRVHHAPDCCR